MAVNIIVLWDVVPCNQGALNMEPPVTPQRWYPSTKLRNIIQDRHLYKPPVHANKHTA
jgi:hypothetical protein